MAHLKNQIFVCLDCETTGLDPVQDRIIEVAIVKFTLDGVLEEYETLINPEYLICDESIAIHHITQEMVAGKPTIDQVLKPIIDLIDGHIIVGHGIGFDIQLLINAAARYGISNRLHENASLDTLRMARLYGESPVNSLEQLRRHFGIEAAGAHRAMGDVIVNIEVFKRLLKDYRTTEEVFDALSRPIMFKTMPLGQHKGRLMKDVPLQFLLWAANKDFDQDLIFSIRSELKRRKGGNLFSQVSNPFQNL